jgi:ketosteroid isomerase-like protein
MPDLPTDSSDVAAVLKVHNDWVAANVDLRVEAMLPCFPSGDGYLQYNLNGLTYRGAAEKARLWRNLRGAGVNITRITDHGDPDVQVYGDVALVTWEGEAELVMPSASGRLEGSRTTRIRNTEFYRRDDGAGGAEWRIWHMHVSEAAPEGSLKYGTE